MLRRKVIFSLVVCILAVVLVGQSLSQPAQPGQGQGRGRQGQGQGAGARQFDPEQMQRMMEQRYQEQLGASDAEWKEIGPFVMKVQELSRQVQGAGRNRMMFGGMGGRRGAQGERPGRQDAQGNRNRGRRGAQATEPTAVETASEQLSTLLENSEATPEQIKAKLAELRAAKEKEKQALVTAQQELQKKATPRQEAQLVLMGLLD